MARATFNVDIHAATREKNSAEAIAHPSYRVTGNAVALGEAAGAVAALAARRGCPPHEVDWASARKLIKAG